MSSVTADVGAAASVINAGGNESDAGNTSGDGKCGQLSLTPRFTQEEKDILYSLFHHHEEVIDIKYRKKQKNKYSVREAWAQIVRDFNAHPGVSACRNLKQIQKFWLNARLRKQYPFRGLAQKHANTNHNGNVTGMQQQQLVTHDIKDEPEFQICNNSGSPEQQAQDGDYEEIDMEAQGAPALDDDPLNQQAQSQQEHMQQHVQQTHPTATIQAQQICVDQISAEKLTLNDLLQFKTARPREEIILQIKHPVEATGAAQIAIPSSARITLPTHHQAQQHTMATITASGYNEEIIGEIKPQQITLAQYQAQQQQLSTQQQLAAHQQLQPQPPQVKLQLQTHSAAQQFASSTAPTFTCTTFNSLANSLTASTVMPTALSGASSHSTAGSVATTAAVETFEDRINYFKLKEAELRFKEEQVLLEKKRLELSRAQEELKHMRELHRLQVEEVKMKIRILQEEEKVLHKNNVI